MNLLTRLRLGEGLSAGERALTEVLLADLDAFLADGTKQLAARAHVSKSTVYRLCEKLGCSGLADLKVRVAGAREGYELERAGVDANFPVSAGQGGADVIDRIERDLAQTLAATSNVLDALFARCFVEDYDANLARRFAYYDRIVGMGGCGGAST